MADEHDRKVSRELLDSLSGMFPSVDRVSPTETGFAFYVDRPGVVESDPEDKQSQVDDGPSEDDGDPHGEDGEAADVEREDPEKSGKREVPYEELPVEMKEVDRLLRQEEIKRALHKTMTASARQSPVQGDLLRRGALTTLVSVFDSLVADLIRLFYRRNPKAIPEDNRALSLAKLRELKTIEDAENYLISKEVDAVLWGSLQSQLDYIAKRLKIDLDPLANHRESLVEIFQRRNVLVHNGGIANSQYLENVSHALIEKHEVQEGQEIGVSDEYLSAAIDTAYVAGLALAQQCWRKWDKSDQDSIADADELLVNQLYDSLLERRFELTAKLAQYTGGITFRSDMRRRMAIVNHAIALKELKRRDEMESVLEGDWSACALQFRLALHALKDEENEFYSLLPGAVAAGEVAKGDLEDWPLFKHLRGTERFEEAFSSCFPEQMPTEPESEEAAS